MDNCHQVAPSRSQDLKGLVSGASGQLAPQAYLSHIINHAIMVATIFMIDIFGPHLLYYGYWVGVSYYFSYIN